jgi:hypothetical protein
MRLMAALICGTLAACASGGVTVPDDAVLYEVPIDGTASTAGGDPFTARIEGALEGGDPEFAQLSPQERAARLTASGTPIDDDRINLMQWTLEQQKIDAAIAERELAEDRAQLVVVQPGALPNRVEGANVALYAQQSTNAVGERRYDRSGFRVTSNCGRYRSADDAQRAFLAAGGPNGDRLGLDPDGDGFACAWDPAPYRQLTF